MVMVDLALGKDHEGMPAFAKDAHRGPDGGKVGTLAIHRECPGSLQHEAPHGPALEAFTGGHEMKGEAMETSDVNEEARVGVVGVIRGHQH
jgi:hypothetical protein